ncbi:ATP-grasp domain-containing protein [Prochlorococcus marinus]|uniref:ATP-grasp domain-containing protein n=1 Tax=Prochlorococcus marinus TaxID=1219 RepID=UPI0022B32A90|nr:ATP-grasp domain-containing protein [Prochlorococcus marinus]
MNIVLIAGGSNQLPLAQYIYDSGYNLILVDPYEDSPCAFLASKHIVKDIRHSLDIVDEIIQEELQIDGVVSDQSDAALETVSIVCREFSLVHMSLDTIKNGINKMSQNKILKTNNVCVPATIQGSIGEEIRLINEASNKLDDKINIIIKPADAQGSKGVSLVTDRSSLNKSISSAFSYSRSGMILIQDFIDGVEYSVDGVVLDNKLYPLVIARKFHYSSNPCIDERNTFLDDISIDIKSDLINSASNSANALNYNFTLIHAELIIESSTGLPYLIEISPRGGGGSISSKIIPYITNYSTSEFLLNRALNYDLKKPNLDILDKQNKYVIMRFLPDRNIKYSKISIGKPNSSELIHLELPNGEGSSQLVRNSSDRLGYFVIGSDSKKKLLEDEAYLLESIKYN